MEQGHYVEAQEIYRDDLTFVLVGRHVNRPPQVPCRGRGALEFSKSPMRPKQTLSVVTASASINRIDFGERLLRRRRIRLPRRFGGRARYGSDLGGVTILQCFGWTIDHLVLRR